jgi:glycosyltransferase involved in cell wall biosynthesis
MKKLPITAIILTKDEEVNLTYALESIESWVSEIIIIDSHSTDRTSEIAETYGAKFVVHDFVNQADQFNWALDNTGVSNEWVLRLDADEVMNNSLWEEIDYAISRAPADLSGFYLPRRVYFMGRWIKHGGYYPTYLLRLFRHGKARSEERMMDEHIILLEGNAAKLRNDFKDHNHKGLAWWIAKHNNYSSREAHALINIQGIMMPGKFFGTQPERKRWWKHNVYGRLPLFVRPALYFIFRYFILLGFLDGKEGAVFHFLQGFWYRFLVDAKVHEMHKIDKRS